MQKLTQIQEEQKLLGEYVGLTFTGIEEDEAQFTGSRQEWEDYELVMNEEISYDENDRPYFLTENESNPREDGYDVTMDKIYLD